MRRLVRWLIPFLLKFDEDTVYFAPGTYELQVSVRMKDGQRVERWVNAK